MRIIIDLQGAQSSGSRNRGIGRYSQTLAHHICQHKGQHDIHLVLNHAFADCIGAIRADFSEVIPPQNIHIFDITGATRGTDENNGDRRRFNEAMREAFIAKLQPDVVLITSLFEGLSDDAVTSINIFTKLPTAVVLYDLIPFINRDPYLQNPVIENWYLQKIDHLKRADLLLSISQSSGNEAKQYLNFATDQVVNISTACDSQFVIRPCNESDKLFLAQKYHLTKPYVMYTGGIDYRKNIERLIRAFAQLPIVLRQQYQLAIVCSVNENDKVRLLTLGADYGLTDDNFIMTGFVPDEDLVILYNACHLFIFPSWHEGFGLPALEAMQCGRPVIASNTSSLPEVIGLEEALFDPLSEPAITKKIIQGLTDEPFRQRLMAHGIEQAKKFNWHSIAQHTLEVLEQKFASTQKTRNLIPLTSRPTLAFLSPLPPQKSGISDYSAELLEELTRHYDITVIMQNEVLEGTTPTYKTSIQNSWINANTAIESVAWFEKNHARFDRIVYQFGNSEFHQHMFDLIAKIPGVVVLHDFYLSGIQRYRDKKGWTPNAWHANLYQSHGYHAVWVEENEQYNDEALWHYPTNLAVLQSALGIIVHSENSLRLAKQWYGIKNTIDWYLMPLLRTPPITNNRQLARDSLGLASNDFVICSFGMMGPTKHSMSTVRAFLASSLSQDPHCHLVFVGAPDGGDYGKEIEALIATAHCPASIHITGWADMAVFRQYLQAADVGVQLRTLSRGETSATVLDCMNYGVATIVNANGSMQDLDKESVYRLPDEFSQQELSQAFEMLYKNTQQREKLGKNAQAHILSHHNPAHCAYQYANAIETSYHRHSSQLFGLIQGSNQHRLKFENSAETFNTLANNFPAQPRVPQIFVDITAILQAKNIEQSIEAISFLTDLLTQGIKGYRIEPIYLPNFDNSINRYYYAHDFTCQLLNIKNSSWQTDRPIEAYQGDIFLGMTLDSHGDTYYSMADTNLSLINLANHGIKINLIAYYNNCIKYSSFMNTLEKQKDTVAHLIQNFYANASDVASLNKRDKKIRATPFSSALPLTDSHEKQQILVDISTLIQHDAKSGIQRVVRALLQELLNNPPQGYSICPVYASNEKDKAEQGYYYANHFTQQFLGNAITTIPEDNTISYKKGDIFLGLDLQPEVIIKQQAYLHQLQQVGVKVSFVLYDILFIKYPTYFDEKSATILPQWLEIISHFDQIICISQTVQRDMLMWLATNSLQREQPLAIDYFHLGADIENSLPTHGLPVNFTQQSTLFNKYPTFLMVGTLEPRKAHEQVLSAFERLWQQGHHVNLLIVGKAGWQVENLITKIKTHPELNHHLFWLSDISDEYLTQLYQVSSGLIAASFDEGFGLPLIEAAKHHLPIIARDIPVFREVAGEYATYFADSEQAEVIADCVQAWLADYANDEHIKSDAMPYLTWKQSTYQLVSLLVQG